MQKTKHTAFTLVELIVVITILAILATVAFISFQGYSQQSRDSVRLADMKNIFKSLEMQKLKEIDLPLPDQKVDITASGTIFQYQGVLEENTLANIGLHNGGYDPLTGKPYGYAVNLQRNQFQLVGFLENTQTSSYNFLSHSFADNSDKYVKTAGDPLGVILDSTTNEIVVDANSTGNIEIENNTTEYTIAFSNSSQKSSDVKKSLTHRFNPIASCNAILLNGNQKGDGIYTINPSGVEGEEFDVYCDMKTDGGGWTLLVHQKEPNYLSVDQYAQYTSEGVGLSAGKYSIFGKLDSFGYVDGYDFLYVDDTNDQHRWQSFYKKGKNINIYPNLYSTDDSCTLKNNWGSEFIWGNNYCFYKMHTNDEHYTSGYGLINDNSIGSRYMGVLNNRIYLEFGNVTGVWSDGGQYNDPGSTQYSFYVR